MFRAEGRGGAMGAHCPRHLGRRRQAVHEGRRVQGTNWSVILRITYQLVRSDVYSAQSCVGFVRGMLWLGTMNTM